MKKKIFKLFLLLGIPITYISALWLKYLRKAGIGELEEQILMHIGVLPILDHYYQPLINPRKHITNSLRENRDLPGIDLNTKGQLDLLSKFDNNKELLSFPLTKKTELEFYYHNGSYESGDAEYLYNMIRYFKPNQLIEIGSGSSTLIAQNAFIQNKKESEDYKFTHVCIEPFEQPWLEKIEVKVIREKVETLDKNIFQELNKDDILFIDSSHIIRPQGDVLFEYLEILPILKSGVIVHIHDIFTPKDYLNEWVYNHILWNEQYLLEAFLTFNNKFKVIGALNYLAHNYKSEFSNKCPIFAKEPGREPGAFWMVRL